MHPSKDVGNGNALYMAFLISNVQNPKAMETKTHKPSTRNQLAKLYGVSPETFKKWLVKIPDLSLDTGYRVLTPKQVGIIIKHLGEPSD